MPERAVVAITLAAMLLTSSPPALTSAEATTTVLATADGYVRSAKPTSNYASATDIRVRSASDTYTGYVQFTVDGLTAAPSRVVLRLFVTDASPDGGAVWPVTSSWSEATLTASTAPTYSGPALGDLPRASLGSWVEADVTQAVTGNGTYSFAIGPQSGNSVLYSSREGANPPQLVISGAGTPPPPPAAPVASFSATPTSGTAPLAVTFTDTSTGTPTSWAWDFDNDGTTDSTAQNPTHTYSSAGTYSVRLTVGNAGGSDTLTRTDLISATTPPPPPAAPVASFSATPTSGTAPLAVTFTDTSTGTPTSWAWDFDNDGTTDSTAQNPTHTYSSAGTYSVRLTVGNAGGSDTLTRTDLISATTPPPPAAPVASFSATPTSGTAPLAVTFTDTSTGTPTSWAWDFDNDGTTDSTAQNPTHTYSSAGTYSVRLTVGNAGGSDTLTRTDLISATPPPPPDPGDTFTVEAVGDAYLNEGRPTSNYGLASTLRVRLATDSYASVVKFDVTGLTGAPASAVLRLYVTDDSPSGGRVSSTTSAWDESTVTWATQPAIGTAVGELGEAVIGQWTVIDVTSIVVGNGTYSFHIGGVSGNSVLYSSREGANPPQLVISGAGTPPPPPAAPVASFSATPTSGTAPLAVTFTDTSTGTPTSWAWDFDNDGTTDSTAQNPTHTYSSAGTYSVRLTVGNAGGSDTLTRTDLISATTPPPPDPGAAVLVGAGDIAKCTSTVDEATAALVEAIPGAVFTAGDNVYENGTATEFANCYDPSWGRFKSRTRPTVGNHEYGTAGASGYFGYFGAAAGEAGKGYYSYDVGSWHIVALNSECSIVSCAAGSVQEQWLRADLAAHPTACTMAIFHRPLFSSASTSGATAVRPLWQALYDANAELIVNGHAHVYERYAPQRPDGTLDLQRGIRQFTIGTGGVAHAGAGTLKPNNEVFENVSYGVMKFTLRAGGYDWQFIPIPGDTLNDAGSGTCH